MSRGEEKEEGWVLKQFYHKFKVNEKIIFCHKKDFSSAYANFWGELRKFSTRKLIKLEREKFVSSREEEKEGVFRPIN